MRLPAQWNIAKRQIELAMKDDDCRLEIQLNRVPIQEADRKVRVQRKDWFSLTTQLVSGVFKCVCNRAEATIEVLIKW